MVFINRTNKRYYRISNYQSQLHHLGVMEDLLLDHHQLVMKMRQGHILNLILPGNVVCSA